MVHDPSGGCDPRLKTTDLKEQLSVTNILPKLMTYSIWYYEYWTNPELS